MFELWFGTRVAPFAVPTFTLIAVGGLALVLGRPPREIDLPATPCDSDACSRPFGARPCSVSLSGRFADQVEKARRGRRKWPICRPHDPD
jgi:hypothetical protein